MRKIGLLALAAFGVACGGDDPTPTPLPAPPPGSIVGQALLFDSLNHANTTVTMRAASRSPDISTSVSFTTATDPSGGFEFKNVPPGTYVTTYAHETYVDVSQPNVVVSDSNNGQRTLDRAVLTRAAYVVGGQTVLAGNRSPVADRQFFLIDGQLGIYSQDTGQFGSFAQTLSVVGGTMAPDAKNALLLSGNSASLGTTDALYAAHIEGNAFAPPVLISANAVQAGVSPNSSRAFVFTANGNPGNVDLWTFTFADTKAVTKVAGDVSYSSIVYAADPTYPAAAVGGAFPYAIPVYGNLGYLDNPHLVAAAVAVSDFNVFDVNTGTVSKFANVLSRTTLPLPAGAPPLTTAMQLITTVPDASGLQRDVYLWNPGVSLPAKINAAPLPAGGVVDTSSSPGHAFLVTPTGTGGTDIAVFDVSATPNLRTVAANLLWSPGSSIGSYFAQHGRTIGPNKYYVLGKNGSFADLVSIDLTTLTSSVVQPNLTKVGGGTFASFDDLTISSPSVFRSLSAKSFELNIAANASQLTPVIVDGNGPHQVTGLFASSAFTSLVVNDAGTALAFLDGPTSAHHATIPAAGAATPNTIPLVAATEAIAISPSGARLAYSAAGALRTTDSAGADEVLVGAAASSVTKLAYFDPGLVAATGGGAVSVGVGNVAASAVTAFATGAFSPTFFGFADGTRVLVHNGVSTLLELPTTTVPPTIAATYTNTGPSFVTMNGPRTQAVIVATTFSTGPLTAVTSNGLHETPPGSWAALPTGFALSPSGSRMYFRDTAGRVLAFDAAAPATQVATAQAGTTSSFLRSFHGGADFVLIETTATGRDLVLVNADTATRSVIMKDMLGTSIVGGASATLDPWVSADGTTIFATGNVTTTPGAPANNRLVAYTTSLIALGDNVASSPFPTLDVTGKNLLFQTNKESLLGTATLTSFPLGGAAPVVLAAGVRSFAFSPDTKSLAAIVVKDGATVLQSGAVGQPATAMGPVGLAKLAVGTNLFFSDDGLRLFALDSPSTGFVSTSAILWAGAVGGNALTGVTTNVLGVFPDRTGKQAGVLTKNLAVSGSNLNRFHAP